MSCSQHPSAGLGLGIDGLHAVQGLASFEDVVCSINDQLDNRVEDNLRAIATICLLDLPCKHTFTVEDFVATQTKAMMKQTEALAVR